MRDGAAGGGPDDGRPAGAGAAVASAGSRASRTALDAPVIPVGTSCHEAEVPRLVGPLPAPDALLALRRPSSGRAVCREPGESDESFLARIDAAIDARDRGGGPALRCRRRPAGAGDRGAASGGRSMTEPLTVSLGDVRGRARRDRALRPPDARSSPRRTLDERTGARALLQVRDVPEGRGLQGARGLLAAARSSRPRSGGGASSPSRRGTTRRRWRSRRGRSASRPRSSCRRTPRR